MEEEQEKVEEESKKDIPLETKGEYGPTSFQEMDQAQAVAATREAVMGLTDQFIYLTRNIMYDDEIEDKSVAVMSLAGDFAARVQNAAKKEQEGKSLGVWNYVKELFGFGETDAQKEPSSFTTWKEGDLTYWLAVYTNNFRDSDSPPEILSSESHKEFVEAVDSGQWPQPELWLWHVKGTKWGQTTFLAYDEDTGFTVAVGLIDEGKEHIAQSLAEMPDVRVSHGMPGETIERDKEDDSIIVRYRTREISPLPGKAAANKATTFSILKENNMTIPEHKKPFLEELGILGNLEAALAEKKEELDAAGVESKDIKDSPDVEPEAKEEPEVEIKDEQADAPEEPETIDLVAVIADAISQAVEPLRAEIADLKETQVALSTKQAEDILAFTPAQSLTDLIAASVIGNDKTKIDGRSSRAKDGPVETEAESYVKTLGIPFVDAMRRGKDWRETFPNAT